MTRLRYSALLALGLLLPAWINATDLKPAVINMERVFDEYYKTKAFNLQLKAREDEALAKRKNLVDDVKELKDVLENLNAEAHDKTLSDAERAKKKEQAEEKFTQYQDAREKLADYDTSCKKEIGDQLRQTHQKLLAEIRAAIQDHVKTRGYTLVLDSSGRTMNTVEAIVYADPSFDITADILAIVNKDAPKELLEAKPVSRRDAGEDAKTATDKKKTNSKDKK